MATTTARQPTRTELVEERILTAVDLRRQAVSARTASRAFNDFAGVIEQMPTTSAIADEVQAHLAKYARAQGQALIARADIQDRQAQDSENGL